MSGLLTDAPSHAALLAHASELQGVHLRDLLAADGRGSLVASLGHELTLDYSRQKVSAVVLDDLEKLYHERGVPASMAANQAGAEQNQSEGRSVLHTALRAARCDKILDMDGTDVVPEVYGVLDRIASFSAAVRSGEWSGATGEPLTNTVVIGIGGSYLGPEFVCEALRFDAPSAAAATGRTLRFLANVDPSDVWRATADLDPARTLVVIVSKTFTTAETMLNAKTLRSWLTEALGDGCVPKHMVAVSSALDLTEEFGVDSANVFGFWDWVGGRVSVSSAVGALPIALQYGYGAVSAFHDGLRRVDQHVLRAPFRENIPALLGMLSIWNISYRGIDVRAVLPYSQALARFPAHIQQLDMESNGKSVSAEGVALPYGCVWI